MNYRFDRKQKTLSFGNFPDLSLAKAREVRDIAREALALGLDPAEERKAREREARIRRSETFKVISDEWLDRLTLEGRATKTLAKLRWMIDIATPLLGNRPIADITVPELLQVLRSVEARGRYETATRLRSTFGTIFRYAIATGRAQRDISADLHGALITPKVKHRAAILDPAALGGLLRAIDTYNGHGFRATASTVLNESRKWHPDAIERQLAHVDGNKIRRAYARGELWDEAIVHFGGRFTRQTIAKAEAAVTSLRAIMPCGRCLAGCW